MILATNWNNIVGCDQTRTFDQNIHNAVSTRPKRETHDSDQDYVLGLEEHLKYETVLLQR